MITTVLFDLDCTLLPMDQDRFVQVYLKCMAANLAPHGYDPELFTKTIQKCTGAMVMNDGKHRNDVIFWQVFESVFGKDARKDEPLFEEYYHTDFQRMTDHCGFDPRAAQAVREIKAMGYRVALATNPFFPAIATHSRVRWAGLTPEDFELITTYENSYHCKPNLDYYRDVLASLNVNAEECVMVGNDVSEDMIAEELGMQVFLLTDCMINKHSKDISRYPRGSFPELMAFIRGLNK